MALRLVRFSSNLRALSLVQSRCMSGEGSGKGGGTGGTIREAGGSFGKREAALEEQYFRRKQAEQLEEIRLHHNQEVDHHIAQIKQHQEAIDRHKSKMKKLEKMSKDD